ncbi:MAG: hypothetical protein ACREQ5_02710 [Candidatus Dormibacteria bacterium]
MPACPRLVSLDGRTAFPPWGLWPATRSVRLARRRALRRDLSLDHVPFRSTATAQQERARSYTQQDAQAREA